LCLRTFALFTLHTLLNAIIYYSQRGPRMIPREWIISHRCSWIAVYIFFVIPRVNIIVILVTYARCLYSINCPAVICLPCMLLFILWRDTTSELWTLVQFPLYCYHLFTLLALFTFLHITIAFHLICSILCLQQIGEIDNLIVSWEQSSWLCCVQVSHCC
jgi:hypothetical protein